MYLGGHGGECYRNYQIAPVAPHQEKMWQVVADCAEIMVAGCKPGRACSDVARDVLPGARSAFAAIDEGLAAFLGLGEWLHDTGAAPGG